MQKKSKGGSYLEDLINNLENSVAKIEGVDEQIIQKEQKWKKKLTDFKQAVGEVKKQKEQQQKLLAKVEDAEILLAKVRNVPQKFPARIRQIIKNCEEMLLDSQPDKTADYFEEKELILEIMDKAIELQDQIESLSPEFNRKQQILEEFKGKPVTPESEDELEKVATSVEQIC